VLLVYRPKSSAVAAEFFNELAGILDRLIMYVDPIVIAGDFNICLDRDDDPAAGRFADLLAAYGLTCRVTSPTHDHGGLLDVVATHSDHPLPDVDVHDVGLSDHRLLRWSMLLDRPCPSTRWSPAVLGVN
jgi:hypothetical protein